jgi:hypothetical protein
MSRQVASFWIIIVFYFSGCYTQVGVVEQNVSREDFCALVEGRDFDATGPIINNFLATLEGKDDKSLEKLKTWLEGKGCVKEVELVCKSCILTFPAQSHVRVRFDSKGQIIEFLMDVSMGEKLRFLRYHGS